MKQSKYTPHVFHETLYWYVKPEKLASAQAVKPAVQADVLEYWEGMAVTMAGEVIPRKVNIC